MFLRSWFRLSVGASPINLGMVTAADRAAATCQLVGKRIHLAWVRKPEGKDKLIPSYSSGEGVWGGGASLREAAASPASPLRLIGHGGSVSRRDHNLIAGNRT